MNFAGPFDSELSHDSPVSLGGKGFAFDSKPGFVQHHASDSHVVVPDAHLLFSGDYTRIGSDLIISGSGQKFVVGNYFKGEARPSLTTKDGATLAGHIVDALTGHVHYAQATAAPAAGVVIGTVLKMSGSCSVIRNGVSIELQIGAAVQKGDVIQTGSDSSIGMTFVDGSAFGMTSNARMVLNEMIFDPNGSSNSSLMSLVQGTITFVAGQTAKNGNMRVETPVATMGIRGTAVLVEIAANDGPTKFSVLVEPDGTTGSFNLYDKISGQLIGTVSQAGQVTFVSSLGLGQPPTAIEQLKTLQDQQAEKAIIQQVFQLYFPNYNPDDSNPKLPKFGSNTSGNNLAEILFTTNSNNKQTFLTQIELRFAVTDPLTGITTYQNRIFYNTKAVFSASSILAEQAFVSSVESFKISDLVHIDDPDIGNAPFYDIATPFVAGSAIIKSAVSTNTNLSADFLSQFLHINQTTGVITFDRLGFNFLGDGESVTFMIQVTSRSGPDVANVIIPITITGDNDVPNDNGVPNGAPTIVLSLSDIIGAVKEDTLVTPDLAIVKNGTITFRDVDLSDGHEAGVVFTSSNSTLPGFEPGEHLGSFTLDPVQEDKTDTVNTGTIAWHFTLNDNDPKLQSLAEGQTITQVYTITIIDDHGAFVTQTVTITITGTNDAPVLTADTSVHQAVEVPDTTGAPNSVVDVATGTLAFTDLDLSDTHQASAALHPGASVVWSGGVYNDIPQATRDALNTAMTALVSENNTDTNNQGSVSWEFKLPDHLFDFLADNENLTLTYDVTVTDNNGVSSTKQVTVQVGAANDKPVISIIDASAAVQEDVGPVGGFLKDSGAVTFTDTDLTDTHTAHVAYNGAVGGNGGTVSAGLLAVIGTALSVPSATIAAGTHTLSWDFALNNSVVQYLAEGETVTATYTITVKDNSGETNNTSVGQTVTVIITGTNDRPIVTAVDVTGAVKEDASVVPVNTLHDTGSVAFSDVDATDHETASVAFVSDAASSGVTISGALHTALQDALTLQASTFATNAGTINWDFDLDNSLVQYLAEGETVTATYTITVKDDSGTATDTSTQQTVTVTITGTNDTPVITAVDVAGAVKEDTSVVPVDTLHDTGSVTFADADATDHATASATFVSDSASSGVTISGALHTALQDALTLQASTFATNAGTINWDFDLDNSLVQYLAEGETVTVTYSITVKDDSGTATDTSAAQTVTVVITGTNDAPVVSSAVSDINAVEDGSVSVLDALANASDVDNGHLLSVVNVPTSLPAGVTYDAVHHTFTLDPGNAAYQHLAAGQTTVVTVNYGVTDGIVTTPTAAAVSWTIAGTNDAPTVSGAVTATVAEDASASTLNALVNASDVDDGTVLSVVNVPTSLPAGVTYDAVHHTFTLDPANAAYQHLAAGQSTVVTVSYAVTDGTVATPTPASVSWTINGTNDAPTVAAALTDTANEGDTAFTRNLLTGANDVDDGDTLSVVNVTYKVDTGAASGTAPAGISLTGSTLNVDPTDPSFNHLGAGQHTTVEVSYDVKDLLGLMIHQTETVTINGINDAPVMNADNVTPVELGGGVTKVLSVTLSDVDAGSDTFTVTATADHGTVSTADAVPVPLGGPGVSGSFADISNVFANGAVYTPDNASPTDKVTLTVTDSHGGSDTLNFIFKQFAPGGVTLDGTAGKDWILSSTGNDVMTGGAGHDNFVFAPSSGQDTVMDFTHGDDKIDLHLLTGGPTTATIVSWLTTATETVGSDTLLHLNGTTDTVLLKGVTALNASDFILHA
ncbi:MAG: VCBS domain-containing protein [Pseudomonadota bacterium]